MRKKYLSRIKNWGRAFGNCVLPPFPLPQGINRFLEKEKLIEKTFLFSRLIRPKKEFSLSDVLLRTAVFIKEGRKHNVKFRALRGPFGFINYFLMELDNKTFLFEGLPRVEFFSKGAYWSMDDKAKVKRILKEKNLPVLEGKAFWWFQRKKAFEWAKQLGFPLVVKPRTGSFSQCVTTDIKDVKKLNLAINKVLSYFPNFIIEKFLPKTFVFRGTVIDFKDVFCVQQIPANVISDGIHKISELIEIKNKDPKRGDPQQRDTILCQLVSNETTERLLTEQGYNLSTIPKKGEIIWLQKDSFLKLGGDLIEATPFVHPDNLQLFRNVAKLFNAYLVGIDFLAQDISLSWRNQPCAVLELNSLPCIEMHHFPFSGRAQNVAQSLLNMVSKYYR